MLDVLAEHYSLLQATLLFQELRYLIGYAPIPAREDNRSVDILLRVFLLFDFFAIVVELTLLGNKTEFVNV